jgi:outer membrane protein
VAINKNTFRNLLFAALLVPAGAQIAAAQKVGFVASEAIFDRLPEMKAARAKLAELQSGWQREIQQQEQEIAKLKEEMETNRLLWSQQERRDAEVKLRDLESKLASFRASKYGPDGEYEKQHADLVGPIFDKVSKAIEEEAKAQKYDYVFDKSSRGMAMLYANPDNDLTVAVLQRLGVKVDAAELKESGGDQNGEKNPRNPRNRRERESQPPVDPNQALEGNDKSQENPPPEPVNPNGGTPSPK